MNSQNFKEWLKEEQKKESKDYKKFFRQMLDKYGVDEPDELSDKEKKKFFDEVDKKWKADNEISESRAVAIKTIKLKNGKKIQDGEEYDIRSENEEIVYLKSGKFSFEVSQNEFDKYFERIKN